MDFSATLLDDERKVLLEYKVTEVFPIPSIQLIQHCTDRLVDKSKLDDYEDDDDGDQQSNEIDQSNSKSSDDSGENSSPTKSTKSSKSNEKRMIIIHDSRWSTNGRQSVVDSSTNSRQHESRQKTKSTKTSSSKKQSPYTVQHVQYIDYETLEINFEKLRCSEMAARFEMRLTLPGTDFVASKFIAAFRKLISTRLLYAHRTKLIS